MRHGDYRTTLKHYTALRVADSANAIQRVPSIGETGRAVETATGTTGQKASPNPQQSGHDSVRDDAKQRDTVDDDNASIEERNSLSCDEMRQDASENVGGRWFSLSQSQDVRLRGLDGG